MPESLPRVRADPSLLERAIANLVDNAITWSPPGKGVRLDAASHQERIVMRVVDQGPGISEEERSRVLQPFQRGNHAPAAVARDSDLPLPRASSRPWMVASF